MKLDWLIILAGTVFLYVTARVFAYCSSFNNGRRIMKLDWLIILAGTVFLYVTARVFAYGISVW